MGPSIRLPPFWIGSAVLLGLLGPGNPSWPDILLDQARAQAVPTAITADGTLGTVVIQAGITHDITGGTRPGQGTNLFHSFRQFSVGAGEIANFLNDSGLPTTNILSRVTGGDPSQIFGTIQTTGFGTANVFLMNPAGVLFGPTASLNIGGSFHVTTADVIRLADGTPFNALPGPPDEVLATAPPEAFGFLNENPAAITVDRSRLQVRDGRTISLVGGPLAIESTFPEETRIEASSGRVHLVSVASPGEVVWNGDIATSPHLDSFHRLGSITIHRNVDRTTGNADIISTAGDPGGTIVIRAGRLELVDAGLVSSTKGSVDHPGLGLDIEVRGDLIMERSEFGSSTFGAGKAGRIRITAGNIHMMGTLEGRLNSNIGSRAFSTQSDAGDGNDIEITAGNMLLEEGAVINTTTFGPGQAGNIRVHATALELDGTRSVAFISSSTEGSGNAGALDITAQRVRMAGGPPGFTGLASQVTRGTGNAERIRVTATSLELHDGAQINASVLSGAGTGGNIEIHTDTLLIAGINSNGFPAGIVSSSEFPATGTAGNVRVATTGDLTVTDGGFITSFSTGFGNSGNVDLQADNLFVTDDGGIFSSNLGAGLGGDITVTAGHVSLSGLRSPARFHGIFSVGGFFAQGAGNIAIAAGTIEILDGALVSARTNGGGPGGDIDITADHLVISGTDPSSPAAPFDGIASGIVASTLAFPPFPNRATGDGGSITLNVPDIELRDHGRIHSRSTSFGSAGTIAITSEALGLTRRGTISGESTGIGNAGAVTVQANDVSIAGVATSADPFGADFTGISTRTVTGAGGDLAVIAHDLQVTDKGVLTASTAGAGQAGDIDLRLTGGLTVVNGGAISASTAGSGAGGTIAVTADSVSVSGTGQFNGPEEEGASTISSQTLLGGGDAGNIEITARTVSVLDGAHLAADTFGMGRGGNITITGEVLLVSGINEAFRDALSQIPHVSDKTLDLAPRSSVTASASGSLIGTLATGQAGSIHLEGGIVRINGGLVSSETTSSGAGGSVGIHGDQITLSEEARVSADSSVFPMAGPAGNILIAATGTFEANNSTVASSAEQASGGNVTITAGRDLFLTDNARVTAQTQGPGDAGDILLDAGQTIQLTDSAATTVAAQADGGNIKLTASDTIHLIDSEITSSVGGGSATAGGNIDLDPQFIILQNSRVLANAFEGQGGNIALIADVVLADSFSTLDASSALGISGSVDIQAPIQNLSGTIAPLPQTPVSVAKLYADACVARKGSRFSSFVARSHRGLPPALGSFLPSPLRPDGPGALTPTAKEPPAPVRFDAVQVRILDRPVLRRTWLETARWLTRDQSGCPGA